MANSLEIFCTIFSISLALFSTGRGQSEGQMVNSTIFVEARGGFLYFAYGSNLWSERIKINNPNVVKNSTGVLKNYKMEFAHYSTRWQGAVASILPDPNSEVYGVLWKLEDLRALDKQEGVGLGIYERLKVKINSGGKLLEAWTYKVTPGAKAKALESYGTNLKPSMAYKEAIITGATENNLPVPYIAKLRQIPAKQYGEY